MNFSRCFFPPSATPPLFVGAVTFDVIGLNLGGAIKILTLDSRTLVLWYTSIVKKTTL